MKIGSLVELVNDTWDEQSYQEMDWGMKYPVKNKIYTVRDIFDGKGIVLAEIDNLWCAKYTPSKREPAFNIPRFRELLPPIDIESEIKKQLVV